MRVLSGSTPTSLGFTLGLLLLACNEATTAPEQSGPASPSGAGLAAVRDTWVAGANMPRPVYCCAAAAATMTPTGSVLYLMGGSSDVGPTARVRAYDVARNSWTVRAPMPRALEQTNGAAVIRGKIYVSGGRSFISDGENSRDIAHSSLFMYDPATNAWTAKARMPIATERGVTEVIKNELYVLTGCGPWTGLDCRGPQVPVVFYRYSPLGDRWTTLPNPPTPFRSTKAAVVDGRFYLFGGGSRTQISVYDPATNQWTIRGQIPLGHAPRIQSQRAVTLGGRIYLVGGVERLLDDTYLPLRTSIYDPATGAWLSKAPMPIAQETMAATRVLVDGRARIAVMTGLQVMVSRSDSTNDQHNWQYMP
jgi:Kelch motif